MKSTAAAALKGFAQKGEQQAVFGGQLAGHQLKEKDIINGMQGVTVFQG